MDGAELDFNNTRLSSSSITATTSNPDDYEKDLRLAAELGRYLLERNHELQNYIHILEKDIDDKQCEIKLLHAKFLSTREQLDAKCKQTELFDAANFDLEKELSLQRRENEKNRQHIKELFDLYEKTRKQYHDIEHEYSTFRVKQFSSYFISKQTNIPCQTSILSIPISTKRQRSNSFSLLSTSNSSPLLNSSTSSNLFDNSSVSIFKSHLRELKSRIKSLTIECAKINDQLHQSEQDKRYLLDRIIQLERQRRDDNDSLQNELNYYRKLLEKYSNENNKSVLLNIYSPPEYDVSLYDEVFSENNQSKSSYEPTNYKELFSPIYETLKKNINPILSILDCIKPSFENLIVEKNFNLNKFLENSSIQKLLVHGKVRTLNTDCFPFGPWIIIANNSTKMILEKVNINDTIPLNRLYYILKTDYEHYSLIYSCVSENYIHTNPCKNSTLWLFSRTISLSNDCLIELDEYIINNLCINLTELEITPQDGESCYSSSNICT
ncbi:unnamed protein product [Rotaria sordida]|uniref:Uncharacterized protein n=1 Tax=Rotaria sordida TaxID=392033 RepID=A0A814BAG6_9BILA|nr:unnamed protein product [Rotaria sordida]CAF3648084.1 unnamed protein product [Rotaria sordida]